MAMAQRRSLGVDRGTWVSYAGTARLLLAIILPAAGGATGLLDGLRAAGAARAHRQSPASQPHHDGDPDCGGRPVRHRLHRNPAWPRGTAVYRTLFFAPLVELTTLSLLAVSPMVKLSRPAFFCLALMLLVFAVWALAGFGYPSAPIPIA
jgi:hypothetical protein